MARKRGGTSSSCYAVAQTQEGCCRHKKKTQDVITMPFYWCKAQHTVNISNRKGLEKAETHPNLVFAGGERNTVENNFQKHFNFFLFLYWNQKGHKQIKKKINLLPTNCRSHHIIKGEVKKPNLPIEWNYNPLQFLFE